LVDGVATLEKLANGGAPSKIVTKLANRAPPLVNGENGERSGTALPVIFITNHFSLGDQERSINLR